MGHNRGATFSGFLVFLPPARLYKSGLVSERTPLASSDPLKKKSLCNAGAKSTPNHFKRCSKPVLESAIKHMYVLLPLGFPVASRILMVFGTKILPVKNPSSQHVIILLNFSPS